MNDPIEDALRTYPLAELPPDFSKRVMRQIQRETPKFRLTWLDYALGFFLALLPGIGYLAWATLPWQFFTRLQYQWLILQSPALEPFVMLTLVSIGVMLLVGFMISLGILLRPQRLSL